MDCNCGTELKTVRIREGKKWITLRYLYCPQCDAFYEVEVKRYETN